MDAMTTPDESLRQPAATPPLTAPATLRLATPAAIAEGLGLLGIRWRPRPWTPALRTTDPGMYVWVIPDGDQDLNHRASLYIGIGERADGGWPRRVADETRWRGNDHAHGIAIGRTKAQPVGGRVDFTDGDLSWLPEVISDEGVGVLTAYLTQARAGASLRAVEAIAIRMSIHLGDTVTPVNATHAGSWRTDSGQDWAGYAAARRLEALAARTLPPAGR